MKSEVMGHTRKVLAHLGMSYDNTVNKWHIVLCEGVGVGNDVWKKRTNVCTGVNFREEYDNDIEIDMRYVL